MVRASYLELRITYYYERISPVNFYLQIGLTRRLTVNIKIELADATEAALRSFIEWFQKPRTKQTAIFVETVDNSLSAAS